MAERITGDEFRDAAGVEYWRIVGNGAQAQFATDSFADGVAFINAIGKLADAANHHPDVDLRYSLVVVRVETHETEGLTDLDVSLARQISAAARELGFSPLPSGITSID